MSVLSFDFKNMLYNICQCSPGFDLLPFLNNKAFDFLTLIVNTCTELPYALQSFNNSFNNDFNPSMDSENKTIS